MLSVSSSEVGIIIYIIPISTYRIQVCYFIDSTNNNLSALYTCAQGEKESSSSDGLTLKRY